jgi:hypothetical protein
MFHFPSVSAGIRAFFSGIYFGMIVENYKVIGIERVNGDVILREVKESFWIKKTKNI